MRRSPLLVAAIALYVIAWVLPSYLIDVTPIPPSFVRGWEATWFALGAFQSGAPWFTRLLMFLSGLSNVLFLVAALVSFRRPRRVTRGLEWAVWLAAVLNTHWFVFPGLRGDLRIGYYVWVASFVLMAVSLGQIRRAGRPAEAIPDPAA